MAILDDLFGLGQPGASDPLSGLAMILEDIFGPGASPQRQQMPQGASRSVNPGQFMLGGPELKTSSVGEVGASGIPQLMRSPAPQPQQQRQAPPSLMPNLREPSLLDRFAAFAGAPNLGEGIKAATSGMDQEQEQARGTYAALIKRGIEPDMAKLIVSDRDMLKKVVPTIFSNALSPAAPNIITLKSKNEFGEETESPYYWNPKSRKLEPASNLTGGASAPATEAQTAPVSLSAGQQVQAPEAKTEAPALMPSAQPPQFMIPGNLATENLGEIGASGAQGEPLAAEAQAGRAEPLGTPSEAPQGRYVFGPAASEKRLGTGYMQKTDEQGRFLWQRDAGGRLMPVVEPKAAAESRGRTQEQLSVKKGEAKQESQAQIDSVHNIIDSARSWVQRPGAGKALEMGRANFDVGGQVGGYGVGINPGQIAQSFERMMDPNNPAWGAYDNVKQIQANLKLIVARPLMKGQGQVSNAERELISDAIGNLDKASNPADFQFRLNAVEKQIEDMYAGRGVKPVDSYNVAPSRDELKDVYASKTQEEYATKVSALAKKYKVVESDMFQYVPTMWTYVSGEGKKK
jgi:hypothetical protein